MDGFDRTWYSVSKDAAFVAIAKASADQINAWAKHRGWSQIPLVFRRQGAKIYHFWATEVLANHVDTVWPYWNLTDFTPEGRPDIPTPPQNFRSEFLEKNYLNKE